MAAASPQGDRKKGASAAMATGSAPDPRSVERDSLLHRLLDSVKQCQIRFGKKTQGSSALSTMATTATLATENEAQVMCLLTYLETALGHGLKQPTGAASLSLGGLFSAAASGAEATRQAMTVSRPSFWPFVKAFLGPDELARFDGGGGVTTDWGRSRSWLRTALNENLLERYFYTLVNDEEKLRVRIALGFNDVNDRTSAGDILSTIYLKSMSPSKR